MADDSIRNEMDALKADMAKLRKDILGLTEAVKESASADGSGAKAKAQERLQKIWDDFEERFEGLLEEGKATFDRAEQKVTEHPTGSILTAFGLGYVIAKVLDGSRR